MPRTRSFLHFGVALCAALGFVYVASRVVPRWFPQFARPLWGKLGEPLAANVPPGLADLPVVMVDGHDAHGPVAVVLSGNGGWWGLSDGLARDFAKAGITTIGLNSLAYFIQRRTPEETAAAIDRMASAFAPDRPLMLVGYSFGADVAATVFSKLSAATRARIRMVSLLGLSHVADYAIGFWKIAVRPQSTAHAVAAIEGPKLQCFQGTDEGRHSACTALDPNRVQIITLPGGHHFDGAYDKLAQGVLAGLPGIAAIPRSQARRGS
jgi:type IV secretory pathway VirJ component